MCLWNQDQGHEPEDTERAGVVLGPESAQGYACT